MPDIVIQGAREHNLKNIDVVIPRDTLTVFTGVSGSGKSSLAFDTIFQEGQRRFLESLSAYTRQYLGNMAKPHLDHAEGLSPTVAIDQRTAGRNPRSTVGTITEIYDYLRLLYARLGVPHCPQCGRAITFQTPENIADSALARWPQKPVLVLAPIVQERKGEYRKEIEQLRLQGYVKVRIDGELLRIDQPIELSRYMRHTIEVVMDRVIVAKENRARLAQAVEMAVGKGDGVVAFLPEGENRAESFSTLRACPDCQISIPEIEPRLFSFNSPVGACQECRGVGAVLNAEPKAIVPDPEKSIAGGAIAPMKSGHIPFGGFGMAELAQMAEHDGFDLATPWKDLKPEHRQRILYGSGEERIGFTWNWEKNGQTYRAHKMRKIRGVIPAMLMAMKMVKGRFMEQYVTEMTCPCCQGKRLAPLPLAVKFRGRGIDAIAAMPVSDAARYFRSLEIANKEGRILRPIVKEILMRLVFVEEVGLGYLTLDRSAATLAGGEAQRIRLARQLGAGLQGVTYVLDEPSIGLHPRDNARLIKILKHLRDQGNTVLVVEHDEETIRSADHVLDIGPGAGRDGGRITAQGDVAAIKNSADSLTGQYLNGAQCIPVPAHRRLSAPACRVRLSAVPPAQAGGADRCDAQAGGAADKFIVITGASANNLKDIEVKIPLARFVAVTGVSGSGKSSLVDLTLKRALARQLHGAGDTPGVYRTLTGAEWIDKVIEVDQSPIGRTPRSNPATYTKLMDKIRDLYAVLPESRVRGYAKGRFSFNVTGGRCENCRGAGVQEIEMQFLANVQIPCEACQGKRYNPETLLVQFRGKSISEVLDMTADEALAFFQNQPSIHAIIKTMVDVGLGYVSLGQPATTLSGGEAQRVKLAAELHRPSSGRTLYILDEPTTGLHIADVHKLIDCLQRLVDKGNTVLLVEHNLDVIKVADHVIDLGPEGGREGGHLVACGTPEEVAQVAASYTGQALTRVLLNGRHPTPTKKSRLQTSPAAHAIVIQGASKHNLKGIDVEIPHQAITVITGVSGSGKSTLAFDTVFSEGQRRFVESMSTYARRFLGRMDQADVKSITGLAPAIAIDQNNHLRNPRSTVATTSEIYDYLRLLFARTGVMHCVSCRTPLAAHTPFAAWKNLVDTHPQKTVLLLAPMRSIFTGAVNAEDYRRITGGLMAEGFTRLWLHGEVRRLEEPYDAKAQWPQAQLVIYRGAIAAENREALVQALELAFTKGDGRVNVADETGNALISFSSQPACARCGYVCKEELTPRMFSFNSHVGACPACDGIGVIRRPDRGLLVGNPTKPLLRGAIKGKIGRLLSRGGSYYRSVLKTIARLEGFNIHTVYRNLTDAQKDLIWFGNGKTYEVIQRRSTALTRSFNRFEVKWEGLLQVIQGWYEKSEGGDWSEELEKVMATQPCTACLGHRLRPESLAVKIAGMGIAEVCAMTVSQSAAWFAALRLPEREAKIAEQILREIHNRLGFLQDIGLGYMALNRTAATLSGGEAQRLRMATQLGNRLVGVIYVLDEPTIGLHARDVQKLIQTLRSLKDLGNTIILVEHDAAVIRIADQVIDLGPGAGQHGGQVVAQGDVNTIQRNKQSLTGRYLAGKLHLPTPKRRRRVGSATLKLKGACAHNLKNVDVRLPLGNLIAVTGVSGSGKSSLIFHSLLAALKGEGKGRVWRSIEGQKAIHRVLVVDQKPIGRTPMSNPATYTGVFDDIRNLFAKTPEARAQGYNKSRFSFHNSNGQCWACEGMGMVRVEMHFLSDVWIPCEECNGMRYNSQTLTITFRGKNIAQVLDMEIDEALGFFKHHVRIERVLKVLSHVGLGYMKLGQPATTLSGGEAQRVKLATELCRGQAGKSLYLLDEPTIGLHFADIEKLLALLHELVGKGHTVVVIEHHLDVVKTADYVIDLGPEGGDAGGTVVACGRPKDIVRCKNSVTGKMLNNSDIN